MNLKLLSRAAFLLLLIAVTILSLLPIDHPSAAPNDKVNHLLAWGALGLTIGLGWPGRKWLFPALFVYSFLIEVAQGLSGYRMFSLADALANATGIVGATLLLWLWYNVQNKRHTDRG